jgi:ABC-type branched-subunit amino acid transport system ATPase component/ABC-type branched-subunit amino acid transport system permease subunit
MPQRRDLVILVLALVGLPFTLRALGLGTTSATEVVVFALACLALNILVGYTGLVSFGHGAWFGLAAYVAGLAQREWFTGGFVLPLVLALVAVAGLAWGFGFLVLRRRGVYFSLLTLALAAMLYAVAFRWTAVTGGENGLGGITRPVLFGVSFDSAEAYYVLVAAIALVAVVLLWRFHRSPLGTVLVAIRENEQRARFVGYATNRYKLVAFTLSAGLTGLAGVLLLFNNRMTSAEPISVAFSGELLAMVIIGGMRSFLGPALGALFFVIFRDFLSRITENWLLWFGLLFVAFIVFSPTGLVGVARRIRQRLRPPPAEAAAMAARGQGDVTLPPSLKPQEHGEGPVLEVRGLGKSFGGIHAVTGLDLAVRDRTLHALIGPNGAGKTTAFNAISGLFAPDAGQVRLLGREVQGQSPEEITRSGVGRSFQITNLFGALPVAENVRLAVQARDRRRMWFWIDAASLAQVNADTADVVRTMGLAGIEQAEAASLSYGGQRLLDMSLALATRPRVLLLDEPLAGLAAAERERVGRLIKGISRELPVLLVEHDIDRVFALADHVTVMNEGQCLVDGSVDDARDSPRVQEVYVGSGSHALAARPRASAARETTLLALQGVNTFYGKSHILRDVAFDVREREIVALLGRNGAGKSTLLKTVVGIAPPASGRVTLSARELAGEPSARIARQGVAYVPQGRGLFAGMTVAENMQLGRLKRAQRAGLGAAGAAAADGGVVWDEERVFAFFPRLRERWRTEADYLSGGEQQMVAVARALAGDTRLLLLDEPFEGLAPTVVEELFEAFDKLRQEIGIVIVDHHLDLALALSDRTVVLERGEVVHVGPSRALAQDLDLRRRVLWM